MDLFYFRIPYEEEKLIEFYGKEYEEYRATTTIGIPFISSGTKIGSI